MATSGIGLDQVVALARQGLTLREIGERVGRTRGRIHQLLRAAGLSIAELRDVRCAACGHLVRKAEPVGLTLTGKHYHGRGTCRTEYEKAKRRARAAEVAELRGLVADLAGALGRTQREQRARRGRRSTGG